MPSSVLFVCGDIGGTNSRLQLLRSSSTSGGEATSLAFHEYPSDKQLNMVIIVKRFLETYNTTKEQVHCMCLAVAGPVVGNVGVITNLPWNVSGPELSSALNIPHVGILNDFEGIGYGVLASGEKDVVQLPGTGTGKPLPDGHKGPKAVIGAGTGLGEGYLTHSRSDRGGQYDVFPCEGGHTDFAPRNLVEYELMEFIKAESNHSRVSVERVVSGLGLPMIYKFFSKREQANKQLAEAIASVSHGGIDIEGGDSDS